MCGLPVMSMNKKEIHFLHVSLIPCKFMVIMLFSANKGERMRVLVQWFQLYVELNNPRKCYNHALVLPQAVSVSCNLKLVIFIVCKFILIKLTLESFECKVKQRILPLYNPLRCRYWALMSANISKRETTRHYVLSAERMHRYLE